MTQASRCERWPGCRLPRLMCLTGGAGRSDPHVRVQVVQCDRETVAEHLADADVVVPLMTRLGAEQLALARRLKLIIQFGVGVEGIDIAAVRPGGVGWVR